MPRGEIVRVLILLLMITAAVCCGLEKLQPSSAGAQTERAPDSSASAVAWSSVGELLEDWQAYRLTLADLPREERVDLGLAFFKRLPWATLMAWCVEGHPAVSSEEDGAALEGICSSKLRLRAPAVDTLTALVGDPEVSGRCQEPIVKYVSKYRELYVGRPEGEQLARAFLALADSRARHRGTQFSLERGAACLWASDETMQRMMRHCRSGEPERMEQGVAMLGVALDERAGDSLLAITQALFQTGAHPRVLEKALVTAARRGRSAAFDLVREALVTAPDSSLRRAALQALAWTGDRRFHPILLREYGDSTSGIVDSTHALTDGRSRYWDLWLASRIAEPSFVEVLEEGSAREAALVLELLDRESRYGPPAEKALYEALEAWAALATPSDRERVQTILSRFRAYPDRRPGASD